MRPDFADGAIAQLGERLVCNAEGRRFDPDWLHQLTYQPCTACHESCAASMRVRMTHGMRVAEELVCVL